MYESESISGRDIYKYKEINSIEIKTTIEAKNATLNYIGEGSYALVYKFKDDLYKHFFALKRAKKDLNGKEISRFKLEFNQMSSLNSPYILKVYSYNNEKNEYIMEYMDFTLQKYIDLNNSSLTIQQRKNIIRQIYKGYSYLHSRSIFHRDVSYKNVLIKQYDDTIVVKISDFGLVKTPDSDLTSQNTELKGCLNDPSLRVRGFAKYDLLDEIYALTLLFTFVITGKTNYSSITNKVVCDFINNGTNQDRDKRYQTLNDLLNSALNCLDNIK